MQVQQSVQGQVLAASVASLLLSKKVMQPAGGWEAASLTVACLCPQRTEAASSTQNPDGRKPDIMPQQPAVEGRKVRGREEQRQKEREGRKE